MVLLYVLLPQTCPQILKREVNRFESVSEDIRCFIQDKEVLKSIKILSQLKENGNNLLL